MILTLPIFHMYNQSENEVSSRKYEMLIAARKKKDEKQK